MERRSGRREEEKRREEEEEREEIRRIKTGKCLGIIGLD